MSSSSNSNKKKTGSVNRLSRRPSRRVSISLNQLLGNTLEDATENSTNIKRKRKANARRSTINLRALKEGVTLKNEKKSIIIDPQDVVATVKILEEDLVGDDSDVNNTTNDCDSKPHPSTSSNTGKQAIETSINTKIGDISSGKPSEQINFINPLLKQQLPTSNPPGSPPDKRDAEPVDFKIV